MAVFSELGLEDVEDRDDDYLSGEIRKIVTQARKKYYESYLD